MIEHKYKDYTSRDELQHDGFMYLKKHKRALLSWGTGVGKTKTALMMVNKMYRDDPKKRIHIVVPRINMIQGWMDEMREHGFKDLVKAVHVQEILIYCYNSLGKNRYQIQKGDSFVFDEVHNLTTDLRLHTVIDKPYNRIIALSATVPTERKQELEYLGITHEWHIPLSKVVEWDILPMPKIYVVYDDLDRYNATVIHRFKKGRTNALDPIEVVDGQQWHMMRENKDILLDVLCTPYKKLQYINSTIDYLYEKFLKITATGADDVERVKNSWLQKCNERKRFINSQKGKMIEKFIQLCQGKRTVFFMPSINMCEKFADAEQQYHQRSDEGLDNFNEGGIEHLFVVDRISEGANLYRPSVGVITALTSKDEDDDIKSIQTMGRLLRAKNPVIFIIVMRGTQDEQYFKRKQSFFEKFDVTYADRNTVDSWLTLQNSTKT